MKQRVFGFPVSLGNDHRQIGLAQDCRPEGLVPLSDTGPGFRLNVVFDDIKQLAT